MSRGGLAACAAIGALVAGALFAGAPARAAEIALYQSALQKAVDREVFGGTGRRVLSGNPRDCSHALVEQPAVTLRDGRLYLRARFAARAGVRVGAECAGTGESFWFEVSGRPAADGETVSLADLRLHEIKEFYRPLIETLMAGPVARAVQINLRAELQKVLSGDIGYQATLPKLAIQSVTTTDQAITMVFDFRLEAR